MVSPEKPWLRKWNFKEKRISSQGRWELKDFKQGNETGTNQNSLTLVLECGSRVITLRRDSEHML